jgi:putative membrane protein insertion efficiency factor
VRRTLLLLIVATVLLIIDLRRPPADQLVTRVALGTIHVYQRTLSPVYARMGLRCRFTPTCSHYGEICVRQFGAARGGWMAMKRLLKCGPWTPMGTVDPPPSSVHRLPSTGKNVDEFNDLRFTADDGRR